MLISATVGLPLLPVRGVLAIARTIQQQAEQERSSPAALRRRLEAVEQAHAEADATDPDSARHEAEQVEQILGGVISPTTIMPGDGDGKASSGSGTRTGRGTGGDKRARIRAANNPDANQGTGDR